MITWKKMFKFTCENKWIIKNTSVSKATWTTCVMYSWKWWKFTCESCNYLLYFSVRSNFVLVFHNWLINSAFSLLNPTVDAPPCLQSCVFSTCLTFGYGYHNLIFTPSGHKKARFTLAHKLAHARGPPKFWTMSNEDIWLTLQHW